MIAFLRHHVVVSRALEVTSPMSDAASDSANTAPGITLRLATVADAPAIAAIYAPIVTQTTISFEQEPPSPAAMAARIETGLEHHPWLVALTPVGGESHVAGYASAAVFRSRAAYRWAAETSVYVSAEHRGQGIATVLSRALLDALAAQGFRRAVAGIALPNPASETLHRRLGYRRFGAVERIGWKDGRWIDMSWWQCDLAPADIPIDAAPAAEPRGPRADDVPGHFRRL